MNELISLNSGTLPYEFTRKPVKNINLRVRRDGSVHVSAPYQVRKEEVEAFIRQKEPFIRAAQENMKALPQQKPKAPIIAEGVVIPILGIPKTVRIVSASLHESVSVQENDIRIAVRPNQTKEHVLYLLESSLTRQFAVMAQAMCKNIFPQFAALKRDLVFPHITVRRMTSRYGSCHTSKHAVTLNAVLYHMPERLIEYVVYHEFTHFFVQNHSAEFYQCMAHFLPDWCERKQALSAFAVKYPIIWQL